MRYLLVAIASLLLGAVLPTTAAYALAPACVPYNDSAGLAQALANAVNSGLSAQIEVEQGTYIVPPSGWIYQCGPRQNVELLGGTGARMRFRRAERIAPLGCNHAHSGEIDFGPISGTSRIG